MIVNDYYPWNLNRCFVISLYFFHPCGGSLRLEASLRRAVPQLELEHDLSQTGCTILHGTDAEIFAMTDISWPWLDDKT